MGRGAVAIELTAPERRELQPLARAHHTGQRADLPGGQRGAGALVVAPAIAPCIRHAQGEQGQHQHRQRGSAHPGSIGTPA